MDDMPGPIEKGRRTDPQKCHCTHCGWTGLVADCLHRYHYDASNDSTEPMDRCPECERDEIIIDD